MNIRQNLDLKVLTLVLFQSYFWVKFLFYLEFFQSHLSRLSSNMIFLVKPFLDVHFSRGIDSLSFGSHFYPCIDFSYFTYSTWMNLFVSLHWLWVLRGQKPSLYPQMLAQHQAPCRHLIHMCWINNFLAIILVYCFSPFPYLHANDWWIFLKNKKIHSGSTLLKQECEVISVAFKVLGNMTLNYFSGIFSP